MNNVIYLWCNILIFNAPAVVARTRHLQCYISACMKTPSRLLGVVALALCITYGSAMADAFAFSYTFDNLNGSGGIVISGTLTGTQSGDSVTGFVTGAQFDSLIVDGFSGLGPLSSVSTLDNVSNAVISFDSSQNNFFVVNDLSTGTGAYFLFLNSPGSTYVAGGANNDINNPNSFWTNPNDDGRGVWTLTNTTPRENVPENGTTLSLIGFSMLGLVALRRKLGI